VRDRRYCIRYPFAADVELLDLESGAKTRRDVRHLHGRSVYLHEPATAFQFARANHTDTKGHKVEALGVVRIVKPRIGMELSLLIWNRRTTKCCADGWTNSPVR